MRALAILVLVVLPSVALADQAANRDLIVEYTRIARDAATAGNCDIVRDLGEKIRTLDPAYYTATYVTDAAIAKCLPAVSPVPQPAPVAPPPNIAPPAPVMPVAPAPGADEPAVPFPAPARPPTPPIDGARLVGEVFLGGLASLLGVVGGGLLGAVVCLDDNGGEFDCIGSLLIGAYAGGAAMFGVGVYAAGNAGDQTGSLGMAVLGGVLGAAVGFGTALLLEGSTNNDTLLATVVIGAPIVGSLIGFNSTRRWKDPPTTALRRPANRIGSLVRIDDKRASLGVPVLLRGNPRGIPTTTLPLLSGSF